MNILLFFMISLNTAWSLELPSSLRFVESHPLDISDPSGIDIDPLTHHLWIVSDEKNKGVYYVNRYGETLRDLSYRGDDLEGITYDHYHQYLWVVEERKREIVTLDLQGNVLERNFLDIPRNRANDGLEGITKDLENRIFYIVNQRNPQQLLSLDSNFEILSHYKEKDLKHLNLEDLSGLFFHPIMKKLWIISSRSREIIIINPANLEVRTRFPLNIKKPEGVSVSTETNEVFIVCDEENKLYIYRISY